MHYRRAAVAVAARSENAREQCGGDAREQKGTSGGALGGVAAGVRVHGIRIDRDGAEWIGTSERENAAARSGFLAGVGAGGCGDSEADSAASDFLSARTGLE